MESKSFPTKVGDLRPTQVLHTFGVGAIVDLPNIAAMILGLDDWNPANMREIGESRLLAVVRKKLGSQVERLNSPPAPAENRQPVSPLDAANLIGVPVILFPRWLRCPLCNVLARVDSGLFQLKTDPYHPDRTQYVHEHCAKSKKAPTVVPARFLVACSQGHLDDFPWIEFVHRGTPCNAPQLRLYELGVTGQAAEVQVQCTNCDKPPRSMSEAFGEEGRKNMPQCRGRRPHLRDFEKDGCQEQMKAMLLGASNSWFSIILSSLSIPQTSSRLAQLIEENWHFFSDATSLDAFKMIRKVLSKTGQCADLAPFSDEEIWQTIEERLSGDQGEEGEQPIGDLKRPEWEVFSNHENGDLSPDFRTREGQVPKGFKEYFDRVVLVDRLREVRALVGFTRIEFPGDYVEGADLPQPLIAPLSRTSPTWVPAAEIRGEGLFLQFNEKKLRNWINRADAQEREGLYLSAHQQWRAKRNLVPPEAGFPGIRYILLHSFAHALMRQFALECGYSSASIRERIYSAGPESDGGPMAGLLLYTAASDSEGTLGGLVSLGEHKTLGRHLEQALKGMRLCSSDPLCGERAPDPEGKTLHGAACHACLFASETSCERGNKYLDRAVLIEPVSGSHCAFFE